MFHVHGIVTLYSVLWWIMNTPSTRNVSCVEVNRHQIKRYAFLIIQELPRIDSLKIHTARSKVLLLVFKQDNKIWLRIYTFTAL